MFSPRTFEVAVCRLLEGFADTYHHQSAQEKRRGMNRWQHFSVWIKDKFSAKRELLSFKMQSFLLFDSNSRLLAVRFLTITLFLKLLFLKLFELRGLRIFLLSLFIDYNTSNKFQKQLHRAHCCIKCGLQHSRIVKSKGLPIYLPFH